MHLLDFFEVLLFPLMVTGSILNNGNIKNILTTKTLVRRHGYPFEKHTVQTDDGYILGLHRIPFSYESNRTRFRPVAFLMHCLLCSSSDWVVSGRGNSLAYILADAGYDVWLGNARGNTYSRKHVKYKPDGRTSYKFWNFSWHEIGILDLPAMLDYILNITGVKQLRYFGHSQGTTTFFVLTSMKPKYNKIFKSAHLLAPIVFMSNSYNKFLRLVGPLVGHSKLIQVLLSSKEFRPSMEVMNLIGNILCQEKLSKRRQLCKNALLLVSGSTNETIDSTIIPDVLASNPSGSSLNQPLHYIQEFVSGHFRQYDHGLLGNINKYGSSTPPDYPLENIKVPIFLYHSLADNFSSKKDVLRLCKRLKTLVGRFENPIKNFDHMAHMYSANLGDKLHKFIMKDVLSVI